MRKVKVTSLILSLLIAAFSICSSFSAVETDSADTSALNDYLFGHMSWGVKAMGLDVLQKKLEESGKPLPEVIVAVMDTGLNTSNRYLKGRYIDGYNFINDSADYNDDQYHGTEVCGVIADGTSSNVKIMPLKVMDSKGDGKMSDTAKAIYYALDHGADVINLSLSGDDKNHTYHSLDDAIAEAVSRGVTVIVAAGNQDCDASTRYPANKDNVITITSVYKNNSLGLLANYGSAVDFALPGMNILAPRNTFMLLDSGTSLAAPHAAAAAALLKTWDKSLNQAEIYEIFKEYSVDLGAKGFDDTFGWGMIDLSSFDINSVYVPPTEPEETFIPGDADSNGEVEVADVSVIQRMLADLPIAESCDSKAADVDQDGEVLIFDAAFIQRHLAGVEIPYKVG